MLLWPSGATFLCRCLHAFISLGCTHRSAIAELNGSPTFKHWWSCQTPHDSNVHVQLRGRQKKPKKRGQRRRWEGWRFAEGSSENQQEAGGMRAENKGYVTGSPWLWGAARKCEALWLQMAQHKTWDATPPGSQETDRPWGSTTTGQAGR